VVLAWLYALFAAIIEVVWVLGLKYSSNALEWTCTIIAIFLSFYLIINASEEIPTVSVYAVFTGSGSVAIATIDFLFLSSEFMIGKGLFILLIIIGVVGIQLTTPTTSAEEG